MRTERVALGEPSQIEMSRKECRGKTVSREQLEESQEFEMVPMFSRGVLIFGEVDARWISCMSQAPEDTGDTSEG